MNKKKGISENTKGFYRISWDILRKNRLAMICLFIVAALIVIALFAPLIAPRDPDLQIIKEKLQKPGPMHWLGTDEFGRDILSRIIYGCRISLSVGVISQLIGTVIGFSMGVCAGYFGKKTDAVISFIIQVFSSFPFLLFAIAIMFVLGPGLNNLYIALGLLSWTPTARLIRGDVLRLKNSEYIQACIIGGGSNLRIILTHLLPNCFYTLIVTSTLGIPGAILSEASMSFLGLGVQPPMASWGSMISNAQAYIRSSTYYSIAPGIAIIITVMAFNLLGDGLRDALDPKMRS